MSTIEPTTDNLIVQRGLNLYTTTIEDMSTIQDDDLVMIGRGSESYKINGKEFKEQAGGGGGLAAPEIFDVTLTGSGPGFDNETYTTNVNYKPGNPAATLSLKAKVDGALSVAGNTGEIVGITSVAGGITVFVDKARTDTVAAAKKGLTYRMDLNDLPTGSTQYTLPELFGGFPDSVMTGGTAEIWGYPDVDGTSTETRGTFGLSEIKTASEWYTQFSNSNAYYYVSIAAYWSGYTEPDGTDIGQVGGQPSTTLTLASDENLSNGAFVAGDAVKQNNSPLVPTSSPITNVSSTTTPVYSDYATAADGWYGTYDITNAFNGINDTDGGAVPNASQPIVYAHPVNELVEKIELKVYETVNLTLPDGTVVSVQGNSGQDVWHEGEIPGGSFTFTGSNSISIKEPNGSTYFDGIKLNNIELIDNQALDVLTLTDASGLSNFEVGDMVQVGVNGSYLTGDAWPIVAGVYDDMTWADFTANQAVEYGPVNGYQAFSSAATLGEPTAIYEFPFKSDSDRQVYFYFGQNANTGQTVTVGGDVTNPGAQAVTGDTNGSPNKIFIDLKQGEGVFTLVVNEGQIYCYGRSAFGTDADNVFVTSISESVPSITTDGGSWNVGAVVVGPTQLITATFVSADPSVPSMTVSDVVGSWSVGQYVENTVVNPITVKPETSAITNVDDIPAATPTATFNGGVSNDGIDTGLAFGYGFSSVNTDAGSEVENSLFEIIYTGALSTLKFNVSNWPAPGTSIKVLDGPSAGLSILNDEPDVVHAQIINIPVTPGSGSVNIQLLSKDYVGGNSGTNQFNIDLPPLESPSETTLTLQDDTDLTQFATGDNVFVNPVSTDFTAIDIYGLYYEDESVSTSPLTSTATAAEIVEQNYFNDDINDANKNGNKGFYTYSDNTITIAYSGLTVGDSIGIIAGSASGSVEGFDLFMSATGDVENSGIPFVGYEGSTLQGDKNSLPKTRSNVIVTASSGSFVLANAASTGVSTSQFYIHWIGGLSAEPNGVISDITGLDMTLSESTGTWEVGQTVTMDAKVVNATTGYLSFDSGTGNVESILLSDPGFKPSPPNNALNFVDPMTGQTWNEELPAGTTLSTKVQAVNELGSSTSDWASITPVPLTTNMTTAELTTAYTNAALLIATFDNRHKVHCGNKAEDERDALITKLAEAGYSLTTILNYL